ncbi:hypothetical protein Dimus_025777 [Dionaea muscipula]
MVLIEVENVEEKRRIIEDDDEKMSKDQASVSGARRSGEEENQQVSSMNKEVSEDLRLLVRAMVMIGMAKSKNSSWVESEGKYEETIKECTKAVELNPVYVKALLRRADAYEKLERFEDAISGELLMSSFLGSFFLLFVFFFFLGQ